jgi:SAM-dependent methyltransferase
MFPEIVIEAESNDLDAFYGRGGALQLWDDKEAWEIRTAQEANFYHEKLKQYDVKSVLDSSAASGFHAIGLAKAGFSVTAVDGFKPFVDAGIRNQQSFGVTFPYLYCPWTSLNSLNNLGSFDAVLCLGASLHHTDREGVQNLFHNIQKLLAPNGVFIVEQRNYERLLAERLTRSTHPCGWRYEMEYTDDPHSMYFRLLDERRGINVRFHATLTLQSELLQLARSAGYKCLETCLDYGRTVQGSEASWIQYVFGCE